MLHTHPPVLTILTLVCMQVFTVWYIAAKPSRWEMHSVALGLLANVMACALVTNVIKLSVSLCSLSASESSRKCEGLQLEVELLWGCSYLAVQGWLAIRG